MSNWLENTPYDLLGVSPTATKKEIQAAYDKARRAERDTRKQRELSDARDQLTRVEKRLSIDAFVLDIAIETDEDKLVKEISPLTTQEPNWLSFADVQGIMKYDTAQLVDLVIDISISTAQHPSTEIQPIARYSGIEQFEKDLGL
jgi:hypothetical protein